jgi:uncharacterized protein
MKRLIFSVIVLLSATILRAEPDIDLLNASKHGDLQRTQQALTKGANMNAGNRDGKTPLVLAVSGGHAAVAKLLIDRGADVNATDDYLITALMFASYRGMVDTVNYLIEKGAKVDNRNIWGMTALMYTVKYPPVFSSRIEVAKQLIKNGANVNIKDCYGNSASHYAGKSGSTEISGLFPKSEVIDETSREQIGRDTAPVYKETDKSEASESTADNKDARKETAPINKEEKKIPSNCPGNSSSKVYVLCEASSAYSSFYDTDIDPLKKNKVEKIKTGMDKYDNFFDSSKKVLITTNFAQSVLSSYQSKKPKNRDTSMEKAASVALLAAIQDNIKHVQELISTGKQLSGSVTSDFTGLNALKAPSVAKGLISTVDDLITVGKSSVKILADLKEIK